MLLIVRSSFSENIVVNDIPVEKKDVGRVNLAMFKGTRFDY